MADNNQPKILIRYCAGCRWLLRASWMAQELLSTFETQLSEVALAPGDSGEFRIFLDGATIWDRTVDKGFPEIKILKRRVRDIIAPEQSLGHCDIPI